MNWYHMMIPQVVGSLGLVGVAAYGLQLSLRVYTIFRRTSVFKLAMGVSYAGLFLMSQVNPGEFCPIPYAFLAVLLFVMAELRDESVPDKSGQGRRHARRTHRACRNANVASHGNHFGGDGGYSY